MYFFNTNFNYLPKFFLFRKVEQLKISSTDVLLSKFHLFKVLDTFKTNSIHNLGLNFTKNVQLSTNHPISICQKAIWFGWHLECGRGWCLNWRIYQQVQTRRPLVAHPSFTEPYILLPLPVSQEKAPNNLAPATCVYSVRYRNARTEPSDKSGDDGSDVESGITGWEQVGQARWLMARTWRASHSGCDVTTGHRDSRIVARTSHVVQRAGGNRDSRLYCSCDAVVLGVHYRLQDDKVE